MKEELRLCIEQDNFEDKAKIITLLKSCKLALKKFNLKRIQCLSEIKTILMHAATSRPEIIDEQQTIQTDDVYQKESS